LNASERNNGILFHLLNRAQGVAWGALADPGCGSRFDDRA
jgi:hypothetical protein